MNRNEQIEAWRAGPWDSSKKNGAPFQVIRGVNIAVMPDYLDETVWTYKIFDKTFSIDKFLTEELAKRAVCERLWSHLNPVRNAPA